MPLISQQIGYLPSPGLSLPDWLVVPQPPPSTAGVIQPVFLGDKDDFTHFPPFSHALPRPHCSNPADCGLLQKADGGYI